MATRIIELDDLLSMVCCLEDYGLNKPVMHEFLKSNIGSISIDEMQDYCNRAYLSPKAIKQGYGEEDYESSLQKLKEFFS
jgi:hypothetical protein